MALEKKPYNIDKNLKVIFYMLAFLESSKQNKIVYSGDSLLLLLQFPLPVKWNLNLNLKNLLMAKLKV